jgi:hypothetical protein
MRTHWHQPQTMRTQPHSWWVQSSNNQIYQNATTCKQWNQLELNETNLGIQQLSYRSTSSTARHIKVATLCVNVFGKVLISRLGRLQSHNLNLIYFILSAMAPYGVVLQLLELVHELTAPLRLFLIVYNCHLTCNLSKPGLTVIPSLPGPAD